MVSNSDQIISGKIKIVYWWTLWLLFTILLYSRRKQLFTSQINEIDIAIFGVWVVIMLLPLVSEVSILGVGIKRQLDDFKNTVNEKLLDIRTDIQSISISTQVGPFNVGTPQLTEEDRRNIISELGPYLQEGYSSATIPDIQLMTSELRLPNEFIPDPESSYLINVRYAFEKEVRRLYDKISEIERPTYYSQMVSILNKVGIIDNNTRQSLMEIYAVTSQAVHGQKVSKEQVDFVQDIALGLLLYLRNR